MLFYCGSATITTGRADAEELSRAIRALRPWMSSKREEEKRSYGARGGRNHYIITSCTTMVMLHRRLLSAGLCCAGASCGLATAFAAFGKVRTSSYGPGRLRGQHRSSSWHGYGRYASRCAESRRGRVETRSATQVAACHIVFAPRRPGPNSAHAHSSQRFPVSAYAAQSRSVVRD
jgi:hypothetical protein